MQAKLIALRLPKVIEDYVNVRKKDFKDKTSYINTLIMNDLATSNYKKNVIDHDDELTRQYKIMCERYKK